MMAERRKRSGDLGPLLVLILGKGARVYGVFLAWYYLYQFEVSIMLLAFLVLSASSMVFLPIVKPWKKFKPNAKQLMRIGIATCLYVCSLLCWFEGIKYCGPLITILTHDYAVVILAPLYSKPPEKGKRSNARSMTRGALIALAGYMFAWWFGSGFATPGAEAGVTSGSWYYPLHWPGGMFLAAAVILEAAHKRSSRGVSKVAKAAGGPHVLFSWISSFGAMLLLLPAMASLTAIASQGISAGGGDAESEEAAAAEVTSVFPMLRFFCATAYVALVLVVGDRFFTPAMEDRLAPGTLIRTGLFGSVVTAVVLGYHVFSVIPSLNMVVAAGFVFAGLHHQYSAQGGLWNFSGNAALPLFSNDEMEDKRFRRVSLNRIRAMAFHHLRAFMREVLSNTKSRRIFFFLVLNLAFMFVEFLWGAWTNSLGLISDAFHMMFDCTAVAIGLYASVIARWDRNQTFTYGYGRVETLSAFTNGVFLVVIALFIVMESVQRIMDPPDIETDQLLLVAVLGLVVNIMGLVAFGHHGHDHGGGGHSHSHGGHGHAHGGYETKKKHEHSHGHEHSHHGDHEHAHVAADDHGHSHGGHGHFQDGGEERSHVAEEEHGYSYGHNHGHSHAHGDEESGRTEESGDADNMWALYIHVAADALGSVGVIISSTLIMLFDWKMADPICSLCIALMVFTSVIPLLMSSGKTLMQRVPSELEHKAAKIKAQIEMLDGVLGVEAMHIWKHCSDCVVATVNVEVETDAEEGVLRELIDALFKGMVQQLTIQVAKPRTWTAVEGSFLQGHPSPMEIPLAAAAVGLGVSARLTSVLEPVPTLGLGSGTETSSFGPNAHTMLNV